MGLQAIVTDINTVPEALREHYTEADGKWTLQAEGLIPKDKLDEFRNNNRQLASEVKKFKDTWGDLDPDEVKAALDLKKQTDESKLIKEGDIDKLLEKRMAPVIKKKDEELAAIKDQLSKADETNRALLIDREAQKVGAELGVAPSAYDDFTRRMRDAFAVKDGKAVRVDAEGNTVFNGSGAPQTIKDFGLELKEAAAHLFTPSGGGGGRAGAGAGGGSSNANKTSREKIISGLERRAGGR